MEKSSGYTVKRVEEILGKKEISESTDKNYDREDFVPHNIQVLTGDAGTGKTTFLSYLPPNYYTAFTSPTHAAGLNLKRVMSKSCLFPIDIFETHHEFFSMSVDHSKTTQDYTDKQRHATKYTENNTYTYKDYVRELYELLLPFCEFLFQKTISNNSNYINPETYQNFILANKLHNTNNGNEHENLFLRKYQFRSKIPHMLKFCRFIIEEAGRSDDWQVYLYVFFWYFVNWKYKTKWWLKKIPTLCLVGSVSQSKTVGKIGALDFLGFPGSKAYINKAKYIRVKCFKHNRRLLNVGCKSKIIVLMSILDTLEVGRRPSQSLIEQFDELFVNKKTSKTTKEAWYDPLFETDRLRICKYHKDLAKYKDGIYGINSEKQVKIQEYFYSYEYFGNHCGEVHKSIDSKFKNERYDNADWKYIGYLKHDIFNYYSVSEIHDLHTYSATRTLLLGYNYLLITSHVFNLHTFEGTISECLLLIKDLKELIKKSVSALEFFIDCLYLILEQISSTENFGNYTNTLEKLKAELKEEDISSRPPQKKKRYDKNDKREKENVLMKEHEFLKHLMFIIEYSKEAEMYKNEEFFFYERNKRPYIIFPKGEYIFKLLGVRDNGLKNGRVDMEVTLNYKNLLTGTMKPKQVISSYLREEIKKTQVIDKSSRLETLLDTEDVNYFLNVDEKSLLNTRLSEDTFKKKLNEIRSSYFTYLPLHTYLGLTIDATQGITLQNKIFIYFTSKNSVEDIIVALTRSNNIEHILVNYNILKDTYEPLKETKKQLLKEIYKFQNIVGWI